MLLTQRKMTRQVNIESYIRGIRELGAFVTPSTIDVQSSADSYLAIIRPTSSHINHSIY